MDKLYKVDDGHNGMGMDMPAMIGVEQGFLGKVQERER